MKKIIIFFIAIIIPINVFAISLPSLHSKYVLLYDPIDKEILYENKSDEVINIASLTKIMTTIVAIENIKDLNEHIIITKAMLDEIPYDASVAGLKEGDNLTYLDLLYASMLPSGADATTALAYGICGSSKEFIKLMNEQAQKLNLTNTHFANVTGYDIPNHHSTTKEVLQLLLYSLDNPLFKEIFTTKTYTLTNGLKVDTTLNYYNHNNTLDLSNIIGSKTGFTDDAGLCMASIIKVVDKELILITLGAERILTNPYNIADALTVIDYLNNNYHNEVIFKKGDVIKEIPVEDSDIKTYTITVPKDIEVYTNDYNEDDIKYEYNGLEELSYKNKKGDKIGTVKLIFQDKVFEENIYLNQNIRFSIIDYIGYKTIIIIVGLFIIVCLLFRKKKKRRRRHS